MKPFSLSKIVLAITEAMGRRSDKEAKRSKAQWTFWIAYALLLACGVAAVIWVIK